MNETGDGDDDLGVRRPRLLQQAECMVKMSLTTTTPVDRHSEHAHSAPVTRLPAYNSPKCVRCPFQARGPNLIAAASYTDREGREVEPPGRAPLAAASERCVYGRFSSTSRPTTSFPSKPPRFCRQRKFVSRRTNERRMSVDSVDGGRGLPHIHGSPKM